MGMKIFDKGMSLFFNSSIQFKIVLLIVAFIIIFLGLSRCVFYRRKVRLPVEPIGLKDKLGPKEWEKQMQELALNHKEVKRMRCSIILEENNLKAYKKLNRIRNSISEISSEIITLIPAARWLFDNYQMMYREIKKDKTSGSRYDVLPILLHKKFRGYPRVYLVAKKMVAISGGHLNENNIEIMLNAYQDEVPLTDQELGVLTGMIGFCLLESIIEVADEIIRIIKLKDKADRFVKDKMEKQNGETDIATFLCSVDGVSYKNFSFHSHVIYLLKSMSFSEDSILRYIEYHYEEKDKYRNPSHIFLEEGKLESFLESNIHALIVSLREINDVDEEKFFEDFSRLDYILSKDPAAVYCKMDGVSKGMYRSEIIKLSQKYLIAEEKIAQECLELAMEGRENLTNSHHVGTYLLGKGYSILRAKVRGRVEPKKIDGKGLKGFSYFFSVFLASLLICLLMVVLLRGTGSTNALYKYIFLLLASFPLLLGIAIEIVNQIFMRQTAVKKIPSLDFQKEIPDNARTFLVMPVLVSSKEQCIEYLDRLERHFLSNRQPNLFFGLLTDFDDAPSQTLVQDKVLEKVLNNRIKELNQLHPAIPQRFSLFIRERKWNASENCFMGWERKRGKIEEFNNLLYGVKKEETSFSTICCNEELLHTFKYVITLDADSNLIRENAAKLVGIINHPLNRPVIDSITGKVKEGYAIVQPSVRNHIVDNKSSRFSKIFGSQAGVSNYSLIVSDIYQDIFNEGVYVGKGIYDVNAFHMLLHNTIPENRVLSHDLLESCYARTAFSSAVQILDVFPNTILSYVNREQRWIRGDWQLLPWLFEKKNLNALSKWKIFDNIRRSLVPMAKILLIILNLLFFPNLYFLWIPFVFFSDILSLFVLMYAVIKQKISKPRLIIVYKQLWKDIWIRFEKAFFDLVFMPYRAYAAADAIIRTLFRLFISKKHFLKWNASESVEKTIANTKIGYFRSMWGSLIPAIVLFFVLLFYTEQTVGYIVNGMLAFSWAMSCLIAYKLRKPRTKKPRKDAPRDKEQLLEISRRTWHFFKDFATKETNWLCPDNYQEAPQKKISDKTSPTNIGLQLLSILSARDFGFETLSTTIQKVEELLHTVTLLPKWEGHLYNWYNVNTLEILNPKYVSTVDSGNFFGHIITMKNGLLEQINTPIILEQMITELKGLLKGRDKVFWLQEEYDVIGDFVIDLVKIRDSINIRENTNIKDRIHLQNSLHVSDKSKEENSRWSTETLQSIDAILQEVKEFKLEKICFCENITLTTLAKKGNGNAVIMVERINKMIASIDEMLKNVNFRCLFNNKRMLFHIGYNASNQMLDSGCYDLMASESSLTSFLAIARGEVPVKHWTRMGRILTIIKGIPCFVSWSGTMFEYLMPRLVMKEYSGSVFADTAKASVIQQIKYAKLKKIPWGISESQYYRFDLDSNYQYKAFGVPQIRLQPSLRDSLVITPYATILALEYAEQEALMNLQIIRDLGAFGKYGYYEAIDYNGPDPEELTPYCIVKSFMAHHQGMNIVAINNYINNGIMRKRFHEEAIIKATETLLEEKRESHYILVAKRGYTIKIRKAEFKEEVLTNRYINGVAPKMLTTNYLSNDRYSVLITSDGDGFSSYKDRMIYRWKPDRYANTGNYIYIKDVTEGKVWSATYNPSKTEPDLYQAIFLPYKSEFKRTDGLISSQTEISLSLNHDLEIRKLTLKNNGVERKEIEITSYMEVIGDRYLAELSHPAFNKLFIESEFLEEHSIFLSKRRDNKNEDNPYIMHMVKTDASLLKSLEYENDRLMFVGRNNTLQNPDAVINSVSLTNSAGFSNDPIMSLRVNISLKAGETASVSFITGVCNSKAEAIKISDELSMRYRIDDAFNEFKGQSEIELKYLEISRAQHNAYQDLISPIFYPSSFYRGPVENIRRNWKNQSFLWKFGVSGDIPIMLLQVKSIEEAGIIKDVLVAYEYLRINRLQVDLIILNEAEHGYMDELNDLLNDMISSLRMYEENKERKSLFIIHSYQLEQAELDLLFTVSMVVFSEKTGIYFRKVKEELDEKTIEE